MVAFLLLGLVLAAVGVALLVRGLSGARLDGETAAARIEDYGFTTTPAQEDAKRQSAGAFLDRLAENIGEFLAGHSRSIRISAVRQDLIRAGYYTTSPYRLLGYQAFGAVVAPIVWFLLARADHVSTPLLILGTALAIAAGWVAPHAYVRRRGRLRLQEIDDQLPDLIDLLVVTVEAGLSFAASIKMAADRLTGALGAEVRLTLQEQNLGLATNEALDNMLARVDTPSMRSFVRSVLQGETLGVSIGQILRNVATDMRKRRRARAEERAHKAPVKMLFPLILFIFPAMFVVILVPAIYSFLDAF